MHVVCVAAARPNFMKIKPVIDSLDDRGVHTTLVHTGQHYDDSMSDVFFAELGLRRPDHHLGTGSGSHAQQTARVMVEFEKFLAPSNADMVVVVGDVTSTLSCALVGAKHGALVAHVESGLRSRDWTMPEEINRVVTDRVSDLLFAPSPDAVDNLRAEGYREDQIHLVGNVMIDTLMANRTRADERQVWLRFGLDPQHYGVITLHRPANVDHPPTLRSLLTTLGTVSERIPLVFPVHPRAKPTVHAMLAEHDGIIPCEPLGYLDFLGLMSRARLVMTDSGGIQEETTVLGVPCLTLRENTERPITITEGTNRLVGREPKAILGEVDRVFGGDIIARKPALWDGRAGDRIADIVISSIAHRPPRPTERQ